MRIEKYDTTILQSKTCTNIVLVIKSLLRMINKSDNKHSVNDKSVLKTSRNIIKKQKRARDRMSLIHEKHHQSALKRNENKRLKENDSVSKS